VCRGTAYGNRADHCHLLCRPQRAYRPGVGVTRRAPATEDQTVFGAGGHPSLEQAIRAHANFVEYVPLILLLLLLLELGGLGALWLQAMGVSLTLGRILHAGGLPTNPGESLGRLIGMGLTWATLLRGARSLPLAWCGGTLVLLGRAGRIAFQAPEHGQLRRRSPRSKSFVVATHRLANDRAALRRSRVVFLSRSSASVEGVSKRRKQHPFRKDHWGRRAVPVLV
jgi:uncharacterized membrane protein YecN with MAPEG domain